MPDPQRRLILANGEQYVKPIEKHTGAQPPEMPRSYGDARTLVKNELTNSLAAVAALSPLKKFDDEAILCLRLHPDMTAKSYDPQGIFSLVRELTNVGSRNYRIATNEVAKTNRIEKLIKKQLESQIFDTTGRMVFIRSTDAGFRRLLTILDQAESSLPKPFKEEIQRIERFNLLRADEQILGIPDNWTEGRVELVLHPSRHSENEQTHFLDELFRTQGGLSKRPNVAFYSNGPLFVSCFLNRNLLNSLLDANPLRTAHPLVFGGFENLRAATSFPAPPPPTGKTRSKIVVGMFDGGIAESHPLLQGHAVEDASLSIQTPAYPDGILHGTAVAGALLYGPLNDHDTKTPLPSPLVSVVSIRTLPTSDLSDIDLYEAIDVIERAVPARKDIKVFNVSFGPHGPILDDMISRFTFALDHLAATQKVTFCVAVGNCGDEGPDLGRIQSPSDLVNGLGIGAYTVRNGKSVHAPYSCRGPGRECGKIKPDAVAFGGCDQLPIHLVSSTPGFKLLESGTSFSSPIVAAICAQAAEGFDHGSALLARALVIHTSNHPIGNPDDELGHGIVPTTIEQILNCERNLVSIIFQGEITAKRYIKLPILLPPKFSAKGTIEISWTVVGLPTVAANHPSDYTAMCIEDTFYPNSQRFTFSPPKRKITTGVASKPKKLNEVSDANEIKALIADGWKKSALPNSDSGNQYASEPEQRAQYKWETIVRRSKSKKTSSVHQPFLVLHAVPRHGASGKLSYAAIVTVSVPQFSGNLYEEVIRSFPALQPVRVRSEAEIRVEI